MLYITSMRAKRQKSKVLWHLVIDKDLRRGFKARCVEKSTTMSDQVEKLIREWLSRSGK